MEYIEEGVHDHAVARFGTLRTNDAEYALPAGSPGIRTRYDAMAVQENFNAGMELPVVTPYVSRRDPTRSELTGLLGLNESLEGTVQRQQPLVIPDLETEALSFSCIARNKYEDLGGTHTVVESLLNTGLSNWGDSVQFDRAWKEAREYGLVPVANWAADHLAAWGSDVFLAPTPIVRSDTDTVDLAFSSAREMLSHARTDLRFTIHGVQFLLHSELFQSDEEASRARQDFLRRVRTWAQHPGDYPQMQNLVVAVKVADQNDNLTDPESGGICRQNLSEFLTELHDRVAQLGGLLVYHNAGNWMLGMLDSGADVVSYRVSGQARIDRPMGGGGPTGPRDPPDLLTLRGLADAPVGRVRETYEDQGAFPTPECVDPEQYWNFDRYSDQKIYANKVQTGVLNEVAGYYRDAGLDPQIPLREAVRSQVQGSEIQQALGDLCPSY